MPSIGITSRQFQGLLFGIDNRQPTQPFIVDGKNFIFDVKGPFSSFASSYLSIEKFDPTEHISFMQVGQETFILAHDKFFKINSTTGLVEFLFDAAGSGDAHYPWFQAYVGGKHYFSNYFTGLIEYDPATLGFKKITSAYLPDPIYSICDAGGRLIVLGPTKIHWSAQDVALDLVPDLATGAGTQSHSLIGGDPLIILPYVRGFLTFTTTGILKSELSGNIAVFRHTGLSKEHKLLTPFTAISTEALGIIFLTVNGLYKTTGEIPELWEPLFSSYLHTNVIPNFDLSVPEIFRMFYIPSKQEFYFSIGENTHTSAYTRSYVLGLNLSKWGSFDKYTFGIGEVSLTSGVNKGKNVVYVDRDGYVKLIEAGSFNVETVDFTSLYYWPGLLDQPVRFDSTTGVTYFPSSIITRAWDIGNLANSDATIGIYAIGDRNRFIADAFLEDLDLTAEEGSSVYATAAQVDMTPKPYVYTSIGMDSYIELGLYGFTDQTYASQYSMVTDLIVGTDKLDLASSEEDWNLEIGEEDWNLLSGEEDWGFGVSTGNLYTLELKSTLDGLTETPTGTKTLLPFITSPAQVIYKPMNEGIYHSVIVKAEDVGQAYHLAILGFSGTVGGNL